MNRSSSTHGARPKKRGRVGIAFDFRTTDPALSKFMDEAAAKHEVAPLADGFWIPVAIRGAGGALYDATELGMALLREADKTRSGKDD